MANYEFPLNERVRTMLRLEDLFDKTLRHLEGDTQLSHHCALLTLFQILDVIDRGELKTDLLQELDRQKLMMQNLRGNPSISEKILNEVIQEIEKTATALRGNTTKFGQALRDNDWLMGIKQRAGIPGGVCEFDVPSYHFWLDLSATKRKQDLESWISTLLPLYEGVRIILHILRGSGSASACVATSGVYQQMLNGAKPAQMLRIEMEGSEACFPEVSANKYVINIRFQNMESIQRVKPFDTHVNFAMTLCNL